MSIIVAVRKGGQTVITADTMHTYGSRREHADNIVSRPKIRKIGSSYIGGVGWSVYDTILGHYFNSIKRPPALTNEMRVFDFFLKFWKLMRKNYQLVNDQPDTDDRSPFANLDSEFIVVNKHGMFQIDSDLTVMSFEKYVALGSGDRYALGALHALYGTKRTARQIAIVAAEAAVHFDQSCGGDIICHEV